MALASEITASHAEHQQACFKQWLLSCTIHLFSARQKSGKMVFAWGRFSKPVTAAWQSRGLFVSSLLPSGWEAGLAATFRQTHTQLINNLPCWKWQLHFKISHPHIIPPYRKKLNLGELVSSTHPWLWIPRAQLLAETGWQSTEA